MFRSLLLAGAFAATMLVASVAQAQYSTPASIKFCTAGSGSTCTSWSTAETEFTEVGSCGTNCTYWTIDDISSYSNARGVAACFSDDGEGLWTKYSDSYDYWDLDEVPALWEEMTGSVGRCDPGAGSNEVTDLMENYSYWDYSSGDKVARRTVTWRRWTGFMYVYTTTYVEIRI